MKTVEVKASRSYRVEIGGGLLDSLGEKAAALLCGRTAAIVSDDIVAPLYAVRAKASLEAAGFAVCSFVFPHGEASKCGSTYLELVNFLAQERLGRDDLLVALGGGVVGDLTGFAAATYQRGVGYIQVPTTLLAMVDSSVGGKTAIDLPAGKNLCGAFYQPLLVLCDTETRKTLPENIFIDGCAEVIKYGVLGDESLFRTLESGPDAQDWEAIITQCVAMKRDLVQADEFDTGSRQLLNLGHTLGHAVEAGSNFALSHGKSVAIGMAMIARAAEKFGFCAAETRQKIENILAAYGLPQHTELPADALCEAALGDKKRRGNRLTLVLPEAIGRCRLHKIDIRELPDWIGAAL